MLATRSDLLEKITLGEDSFLELKEVRFAGTKIRGPSQEDLADELAALANTRGGVLLLGVDDKSRSVIGIPLERLDAVEALVRQACEDSIKPTLAPIIERIRLPDVAGIEQPVLRVETTPSLFVHQSPGGYFHRVGSSKRPIPPDQLARLFQVRSQARVIRYDETPVASAGLEDLDERLWRRFAPAKTAEAPEQLLSKLAMANHDERDGWHPTIAGILLGCRTPERFLPNAFIQAVAYSGSQPMPQTDSAYQHDARDITGPLDKQILEACDFVRKNMRVGARKQASGGREDRSQFDMLAVFEAVTNAVAHRDYSMAGSKVRLRLFANRLEIYTPGLLANTMSPESLPYRQAARNEAVTSLLARCPIDGNALQHHRTHIMDKRGEGVPIILERSEALSGQRPDYRLLDESELLLTLFAAETAPEAE